MTQQPLLDQGLLIVDASQSHSNTPHSVGLPWTSDQPDSEAPTWQHATHKKQISMLPAGFEHAIPASERPKTHDLDCLAIGIDWE
jgi:hypothetical protein